MRICSFLPSATEIICELGLSESLVGVSDECRWPAAVVGKPVVTAARIDPSKLSSLEIDEAVRDSLRDGRSLYTVDAELIDELDPDVIVTQDICAVCAVSSGELASACPVGAEVVSLDPRTFGDVADSIRLLARRLGVEQRGEEIAVHMSRTADEVRSGARGLAALRVFFAEWLEPPFCAGHWLPEMIAMAGGIDVLGRAGEPSCATKWETVFALQPELIVVGPCGFGAEDAAAGLVEGFDHLLHASDLGVDDIVGQDDAEGLVADEFLGLQHSMTETERFGLTGHRDLREFGDGLCDLKKRGLVLRGEVGFELGGAVEVVFHGGLTAAGDEDDLGASCCDGLFDAVLDQRLVDEAEHLLGDGLGRGQKAGAEARSGEDCFTDFLGHGFLRCDF